MSTTPSALQNLFATAAPLFGRPADDPDLKVFLTGLKMWPLPKLDEDDIEIYHDDEKRGFCLYFVQAERVKLPALAGKPGDTLVFVGCFFYADGVDDHLSFRGAMPLDITWSDTASSLVARLGAPKGEFKSKKTGALTAHRWNAPQPILSTSYDSGGNKLNEVYVGIL